MTSRFTSLLLFFSCIFGTIVVGSGKSQIVEHPSDVTMVEGSDIKLVCVVENLPLGNELVQWTKDGFALGYNRTIPGFRSYSMVGDESIGEYNLLIKNASIRDEGVYECQVRVDMLRTKARVTILVPSKGPVVEDEKKAGEVNVLAHATNLITCRSWGGKPAAKLTWYKDGIRVEKNVTYAETSNEEGKLQNSSATLRIWPTEDNDGELYECMMTPDEAFQGTEFADQKSSRTVELNVQKPPIASLSTSPDEVVEGRNLFARCEAFSSKPPATFYRWYLNGVIQRGENKHTFGIYGVNKTLNNVILGCRAVNDIGESEMSVTTLNVLYAPVSIVAPQNIVTNTSTIVNMSCSWDSNPRSLITWYKRGDTDTIVGEGEILKIQVEDQSAAGTYVCVADARGVASRSASARLDVLGPPIFNTPSVQRARIGGRAILNCSLESTPGISHVTWSWNRKGRMMALENNGTSKVNNEVKYIGVMNYGKQTASLIINHASHDDMTQYNCTVHNAYGMASTTITFQEQQTQATAMMVPMIGGIIGAVLLVLMIVLLLIFCMRRKRTRKPAASQHEKESLHVEVTPREDNRVDPIPSHVKLTSPDADSDNPSTASVSSREAVRASLEDYRSSAHNDDGYHTEEANSWNRHEKQSPASSPARSTREDYARVTYVPMTSSPRGFEATTSPYASSDVTSDIANTGYLNYNAQPIQQYNQYPSVQYGANAVVELPPPMQRAASPLVYGIPQQQYPNSYYHGPSSSSSGYRSGLGYPMGPIIPRTGSNAPSVVSSHRSVTPSPYVMGRATPTSILGDRALYAVPMTTQVRPSSSQSSIDQAPSSVIDQDPYENPAKLGRLSSRVSQASRSSEMLNKPMTARMATHV